MFNSNHKFKTEKQDKKGGILRFVCAFLAFALVFGTISGIVIFKNNDISLKSIFGGGDVPETTEGDGTTSALPKEISGSKNFLLYCTDVEVEEIYFLAVVTADMSDKTFKVRPLNTTAPEYLSELKLGGNKSLISAVEKREKIKIDKYIASNADTFALAINYMGGLEYSVDNRVEYRNNEFTLILTKGNQTIKGETLLKYFRYAKTIGIDGMRIQGTLLCAMLDGYINEENVEKGLKIYQKVLSKIKSDSDISYIEASKGIEILRVLCKSEDREPASVIINVQ